MVKTSPFFEKSNLRKVGILGGTFDPPHLGHLRLAEEAACSHGLSRVFFIPSRIPPHKTNQEVALASHRLEMTRLACEENPLFEVSDLEISLQGPSYTVNTLAALSKQGNWDIYFIMGSDSLKEIRTWKDCERLFRLSNFIVVERPGVEFSAAWAEVPDEIRTQFTRRGGRYTSDSAELILSQVKGLDISSTRIRSIIKKGKSIRYLVTESVRSYIKMHNLYRN
jgi:nicotinate-nucleotide adenylyltransferase